MLIKILIVISIILSGITTAHGLYFLILALFGFKKESPFGDPDHCNKFCSVIAARNEAGVIGELIRDLKNQSYPKDLHDIYVVINNCTDKTESIAVEHGADIFRCNAFVQSKGDALKQFFESGILEHYDAFCIFDADNLVDKNFIQEMNKVLCAGISVAQGMRDIKNPSSSPAASCSALYFWVLNRFVNRAHYKAGRSAFFLGTGYMFSRSVLEKIGFHTETLTEDLEFSIQNVMGGERIAMVPKAVIYDEQPDRWQDSANQRKRWATGMIHCCRSYFLPLIKNIFTQNGKVSLDVLLYILSPVIQLIVVLQLICSSAILFISAGNAVSMWFVAIGLIVMISILSWIITLFFIAVTGRRLRDIHPMTGFSVWFYLVSWTVINVVCLFFPEKVWLPIPHGAVRPKA